MFEGANTTFCNDKKISGSSTQLPLHLPSQSHSRT